eukprot:72321_1
MATKHKTKLSAPSPPYRYVLYIGQNDDAQAGIGNKKHLRCTSIHALIEDMDGNYYSSGYNRDGACTMGTDQGDSDCILTMIPITYLKENNLKIAQVFVNSMGDAPFWKQTMNQYIQVVNAR